jgi:hypothetical protein
MAVPDDPTDPAHLTPEQRRDEQAALLAIGVRRLLDVRAQTTPDSGGDGLDVPAETSVHASRPVNATGEAERSWA